MNTGLRVRGKRTERVTNRFRQTARDLALQQRAAGDRRYPELLRSFQRTNEFIAEFLVLKEQRFGHGQIERQLDKAKVVLVAGDVLGDVRHLFQRMIAVRVGLGAKSIPRRRAVVFEFSVRYALLDQLKRSPQTFPKVFSRSRGKLRLRYEHVV